MYFLFSFPTLGTVRVPFSSDCGLVCFSCFFEKKKKKKKRFGVVEIFFFFFSSFFQCLVCTCFLLPLTEEGNKHDSSQAKEKKEREKNKEQPECTEDMIPYIFIWCFWSFSLFL